jgi:SAM-dependent methyltransferase
MSELYDRAYYEDGLASGKSLYNGYKWMPERSMSEAMSIIDSMHIVRKDSVYDFGCAKGFLVKALRLLGRSAFGCDESRYAICTSDTDIRQYLSLCTEKYPFPFRGQLFDVGIAKDVLEHLDESHLDKVLAAFQVCFQRIFVVVPIGDGEVYNVPEYNYDATHKLAKTAEWWHRKFEEHGLDCMFSYNYLSGMKDNWSHYPEGNRFFGLKSWEV